MFFKRILILLISLAATNQLNAQIKDPIVIDDDIQLVHLQDSIFIHVTWHLTETFGRVSSNGVIIIRNGEAVMIDTPMDNDKTRKLTDYLKNSLAAELKTLIIGHFHDDCLGGLSYLLEIGVESIANSLTIEKCKETGRPVPSRSFSDSLVLDFNGEQLECRFFGAGHSPDNITVWMPDRKILFGGCLIKSSNARSLGNLSDAVMADWSSTVGDIIHSYSDIETVIPGHGEPGGKELLTHTIKLVKDHQNK